ncbi:MAG: DUF937 domain-containing protein [Pseudomonadota bacterium]
MSLMKLLDASGGGGGVARIAQHLGIDEVEAGNLAELVAPAIGSAARRKAAGGGLTDVLAQLRGEGQGALFDDPDAAAAPEGRAQGAAFLESILGGQGAREDLVREAASRSGVAEDRVADFLPAVAAMLQGGLQRQLPDTEIDALSGGAGGGAGGGLMGMVAGLLGGARGRDGASGLDRLTALLDADGDGSALDDVLERVMGR